MLSLTIKELASHLKSRKLSPKDVCASCLKQMERIKSLNAFITATTEYAQARCRESQQRWERGESLGILDGIPVAVKDNFCISGIRTTCASKMLAEFYPPYTATVVDKLERRGAVVIGKTNMDEFGMGSGATDSAFGPTKNPWKTFPRPSLPPDDWYISGGSSGGSAIAVATGASYAALGSDTGGSTRNPASRCGVVGLKPTYGALSRHGLIPLTNSMDVPGILAKCVDDAAVLLEAMAGLDTYDSTTVPTEKLRGLSLSETPSVKGVRVGIPKEYYCEGMSSETVDTWREIADRLENLGAAVTSVSLPHSQYSTECYSVLNCCEVASNFARYDGIEYGHRADDESSTEALFAATRHEGFNEVVRGRILAGNYFLLRKNYNKYFNKAMMVRRLISEDFKKVFDSGIDLLLTPVTLTEALRHSEWSEKDNRERASTEDYCTQPVNMAGLPAVSFPCRLSAKGLPLSLQFIGQRFGEKLMLDVAKRMEVELAFPRLDVQVNGTEGRGLS